MPEQDFDRLYAEHAQGLFGFLVYRTGNRALAEDLTADAFERVFKARRGYDARRASEKTWLYTIALNCLRDHRRRVAAEGRALQRTAELSASPAAAGSGPLAAVEDRGALADALATLSGEEREAIALRFGADLTVPEMAALLGEPLTTIEGRVYRALRKLRERLQVDE